eukprot:307175-Hanusia_phi.AAC.4
MATVIRAPTFFEKCLNQFLNSCRNARGGSCTYGRISQHHHRRLQSPEFNILDSSLSRDPFKPVAVAVNGPWRPRAMGAKSISR